VQVQAQASAATAQHNTAMQCTEPVAKVLLVRGVMGVVGMVGVVGMEVEVKAVSARSENDAIPMQLQVQ